MNARLGLLAGLAGVAVVGCAQGSGVPEVESVQQEIVVQGFDDCAGLEQYIEDKAVLAMRVSMLAALDAERMTTTSPPTGFGAAAPQYDGKAQGPSEYTGTNLQVVGVDEADFIKTDGQRILVLSGDSLYVTRSWPADQLELLSQLKIEFIPREMFLDEAGRVVVFSNQSLESTTQAQPCDPAKPGYCADPSMNVLKVTVVDLTDERAPRVVREEYLPGTYVSARRVGNAVRVVTSDSFPWPFAVQMTVGWNVGRGDLGVRAAAYDEVMADNEEAIRAQPLEWWLPQGKRKLADGSEVAVGYDCRDFARPTGAVEPGLLDVATFDLDSTAPIARTALIAKADEVYANSTSLYVANGHWWWWPRAGQSAWTYLHKFDISAPGKATYLASGVVEGSIVDQFSMDEKDGYLRVATNLLKRVQDGWRGALSYSSRVQVLRESDATLQLIGSTGDLAKDERMHSARFIGDKGYLVTYHEVIMMDPLFTIDLSDPANPRKIGELEVPGYSTYLHPIDADHLLAVGVTQSNGVKVSLYDVSDFAQPKRLSELEIGTFHWSQSSSEAQADHKAFNWFASKKLLAIPFFSQGYTANYEYEFISDLRVFKVDAATGITPVGILSMTDLMDANQYYWVDGGKTPGVRRSVMADNFLYAISDAGIRSASLTDVATPLATVKFQQP